MRICILGQYPPHTGGVSSHTYLLSQELVDRGDEVIVLTYPNPRINNFDGVKVFNAWAPNMKGLRGLFFSISSYFKLKQIIKEYNIDLIHAHFIIPPGLVAVLSNNKNVKTAVTIHGSDILILGKKPILKRLTRWVISKTDYIIVVNEKIKEQVEKLGVDKYKVFLTPNAVDIHRFNPKNLLPKDVQLDNNKNSILFVGNLVFQKGLDYLLEAKKILKNECELLIVGDGPLRGRLEKKVKEEKIKDVIFLGERKDVEMIMPSADLFVLPSISEGSPIAILEALASGTPIVATDVGGVAEIMNFEVGEIVPPENSEILAKSIDKLLKDGNLRKKMGKNCRKTALKYSYIEIPY
jgi:glycosyltransferase involved in cell wall biosynthesis